MAKFTPEPWSYEPEDYSMDRVRAGKKLIAEIIGDSAETQANGRLIAAAPEMYELLERFSHSDMSVREWMNLVNELLKKIDGGV